MSEFYVGQKVVCVDISPHLEWLPYPNLSPSGSLDGLAENKPYTVARIYPTHRGLFALVLGEISRPGSEAGFCSFRFRPLEEQSQTIQLFRRIDQDASKHRKITVREDV